MVTDGQFLVRPVVSLVNILPLPEDPVCPGWWATFLAGVPVVGAGIIFVGRSELDRSLAVTDKRFPLVSLLRELVGLQEEGEVPFLQLVLHLRLLKIVQSVVEIPQPEGHLVILRQPSY